jgi:FG-GAP repeat
MSTPARLDTNLNVSPRAGLALRIWPARHLCALAGAALLILLAVAVSRRETDAQTSAPATAAAPLSEALGRAMPGYRVSASRGELRAANSAQALGLSFGLSGVTLAAQKLRERISLRSVSYGGSSRAVAAVAPTAAANRVTYGHGGVSEWYVNGPSGLEQGFTLRRAPAAAANMPVTLSMSLTGNARLSMAADARSMVLSGPGGALLSYGELVATDARGRALPSSMQMIEGKLLLNIDTRGAAYPVRVDPLVQQGPKLEAEGEIGAGRLGRSVALSTDGNTALVSAPHNGGTSGAVWVFQRSGTTWTKQAVLETAKGEGGGFLGRNVALSADGNTALIGAGSKHGAVGAVWVFTRSGSSWEQQGSKLTAADEVGKGYFGTNVALSADGNTAVIGGADDNGGVGAAWVFTRSESTWTQQGGKLTGNEEVGAGKFASSVAISGDGNVALIGGTHDEGKVGAAWVFARSGSSWAQQGSKLLAGEEIAKGFFGTSVALSGDGSTALITGAHDNGRIGGAWVFARSGSTWIQQGPKLTGGGEVGNGQFGSSAALSADGNTALIGGREDDGNLGAVWAFARSGSSWLQQGSKLVGGEESGEGEFGYSLAISSDATTALIGGLGDDGGVGAAWVFADAPSEPEPPPPNGGGTSGTSGGDSGTSETPSTSGTTTGTPKSAAIFVLSSTSSGVTVPPPVLGRTGNITSISGRVRFLLPGARHYVTLLGTQQIPYGTIVDATHGSVSVTAALPNGRTETGRFFDGTFLLTQSRNGTVVATLRGGNFAVCPRHQRATGSSVAVSSSRRASSKHVVRKLWADAHGNFSTQGHSAAGAVLGTKWLTEDLCEGTLIRVTRDKVRVTDLIRHHSRIVYAGHHDLVTP